MGWAEWAAEAVYDNRRASAGRETAIPITQVIISKILQMNHNLVVEARHGMYSSFCKFFRSFRLANLRNFFPSPFFLLTILGQFQSQTVASFIFSRLNAFNKNRSFS